MSDSRTNRFISPPECPVFEPTTDEFEDAFKYIEKIKSIGEKYGLCKIRPPATWRPPFMVDHSNFKFTPRIQKLNEIEATSRVRVLFLLNLSKFWQLQGFDLKTPTICGKHLDFFRLKKAVEIEGGFEKVCSSKIWPKIAKSLKYTGSKVPSQLKNHYEKILYPYDIFLSGVHDSNQANSKKATKEDVLLKSEKHGNEVAEFVNTKKKRKSKGKHVKVVVKNNREDEYICRICGKGDKDEVLLLCDGCDDACHTFCLIPPLSSVPKGDWRCPSCVAQECNKPAEAYGFEQSEKEYTLESFTEMANEFKQKYFSTDPKSVPCKRVEEEFWRILSSDDDVVVQYGADNPAGTCGSGFPTSKNFHKGDERYVTSSWNLNNLPVLPSSVLKFIEDEVSGMKVPWCYVGMAFSCFSWHTEDHWSYSVNYMHWGEPKTWYGVPGSAAEKLEECMIRNVPELFRHSPDLMHQLTTLLNPNLLMSYGVPISRTDQCAGEFIITFPRAYHAGFNQGINFAEAVNYCPPDWIEYGRRSVLNYKTVHRQCVFSLDELFVSVSRHDDLDMDLVDILCDDLETVFRCEIRLVDVFRQQGLQGRRQEIFEKLSDDERQCHSCSTTCFLFSVTCSCSQSTGLMSCLEHSSLLCECPLESKTILYRYDNEEMENVLLSLKRRRDRWKDWVRSTDEIISGIAGKTFKPELSLVKDLILQSKKESYPESKNCSLLCEIVKPVEEFLSNFKQKLCASTSVKTRNKSCTVKLPTISDLDIVLMEMEKLDCKVSPEHDLITMMLLEARHLQYRITSELLGSHEPPSTSVLQELSDAASIMRVYVEEADDIVKIKQELEWYNDSSYWVDDNKNMDESRQFEELESLIGCGGKLSSACVWFKERLEEVRAVMRSCVKLKERASSLVSKFMAALIEGSGEVCVDELEEFVADSKVVKVYVEDVEKIKNICSKVDEWKWKIQSLLDRHHKVHLEELEEVLDKSKVLPVNLKVLNQLKVMLEKGQRWRSDLKRVMGQIKQTSHSLMTKLFHHAPTGVVFQESSTFCDMSCHFQQCKIECTSAIENIRKYNERCHHHQSVNCHGCKVELRNKFHRCPTCRAPLHEKCLVDYYVSDLTSSGCPSCQINKGSVDMESLISLAKEYQEMKVCMWDGEVLVLLLEYTSSWQKLVASELEVMELKQFCQILIGRNRLLPRIHPAILLKDEMESSAPIFPSIRFPKATLERLIGLLLNGHVLDVDLDLCNILSCLVHACQIPSTRNDVGHNNNNNNGRRTPDTIARKPAAKSGLDRISNGPKCRGGHKVKRKIAYEECSNMPCKKPKGKKINWVQCDKCDQWYHLICVNLVLDNLEEDLEYTCPACSLEANETLSFMSNVGGS